MNTFVKRNHTLLKNQKDPTIILILPHLRIQLKKHGTL